MPKFSCMIKNKLKKMNISIPSFAEEMGFSDKYIYDLLSKRNNSRWNEDSMIKACQILNIEMQFKDKDESEAI